MSKQENSFSELALKWQAQVEEHCQVEIQQLKGLTITFWARKSPKLSHLDYLYRVINDQSEDPVVLAWRSAKDELTQAVKAKTEKPGLFAESTYIGVVQTVLEEM